MNSKKTLEALVVGGMLVVSSQAVFATGICVNGVTQSSGSIPSVSFVKQPFVVKCSANVDVDYVDTDAVTFSARGMSQKGMHSFGGGTAGGAVKPCEVNSIPYAAPVAAASSGC
jgi:hypothetical protein